VARRRSQRGRRVDRGDRDGTVPDTGRVNSVNSLRARNACKCRARGVKPKAPEARNKAGSVRVEFDRPGIGRAWRAR
jgi:hypothetical protein